MRIKRSSYYYKAHPKDDSFERAALRDAANRRRKWGYRFLMALLIREGIYMNHKKVERLYREEQLQLHKRQKKKTQKWRGEKPAAAMAANDHWSMDFVHDRLVNGRKIRTLNVVDIFTRECLWIEVGSSMSGRRVTEVLDFLIHLRGVPKVITTDNGSEFAGRALDKWAYDHRVHLHFIDPGKPVQNAYVESFNGKFRNECLNDHWFHSIDQAQEIIYAWREDYNTVRPHSSLGYKTPAEFAKTTQSLGIPRDWVDQGLVVV
jgi:putative transposase